MLKVALNFAHSSTIRSALYGTNYGTSYWAKLPSKKQSFHFKLVKFA